MSTDTAIPGNAKPTDNPNTALDAVATFLRQPSPQILIVAATVAWSVRITLGGWGYWDALLSLLILALWPLQEWLIHVFILHGKHKNAVMKALYGLVAKEHRRHHADPWRLEPVFIPTATFITALPFTVFFWWLVTPTPQLWFTGLATYLTFALHYEWVHYLAHIRWCPPLSFYQRRVRLHRCHHFRNERMWWGVSMVSADRWLGTTADDPREVEISPTRYNLGKSVN